ncbi:hypothetical protein [Desulfurococcus amylolyticus]|uniref:hypothetical protein n=1 Tax=Desulfurococcus amylolyticus TaxID=94694 RepID=UPI0005B209E4|nr:hypothetical protein [Desulfurococcus amylolyticus]
MREASADQCPNLLIRDFKEQDLDEVVEIDKECFEELVRYDGVSSSPYPANTMAISFSMLLHVIMG